VFVALDREGKPREIPSLVAETDVERRRQREAKMRRETRLAHREAILSHRRRGVGAQGASRQASDTPHDREIDASGSGSMGG
jgi:hypothetical protein